MVFMDGFYGSDSGRIEKAIADFSKVNAMKIEDF